MPLNKGCKTWAQIRSRCFDECQPGSHIWRNGNSAPRYSATSNSLADRKIASQTRAGHGARRSQSKSGCCAKALLGRLVANGATRNISLLLRSKVPFAGYLLARTHLMRPSYGWVAHSVDRANRCPSHRRSPMRHSWCSRHRAPNRVAATSRKASAPACISGRCREQCDSKECGSSSSGERDRLHWISPSTSKPASQCAGRRSRAGKSSAPARASVSGA